MQCAVEALTTLERWQSSQQIPVTKMRVLEDFNPQEARLNGDSAGLNGSSQTASVDQTSLADQREELRVWCEKAQDLNMLADFSIVGGDGRVLLGRSGVELWQSALTAYFLSLCKQ